MRAGSGLLLVGVGMFVGVAFATQQLVPTRTLLVKTPPSSARKVLWKVKDTAATVMGDPTAGGARCASCSLRRRPLRDHAGGWLVCHQHYWVQVQRLHAGQRAGKGGADQEDALGFW